MIGPVLGAATPTTLTTPAPVYTSDTPPLHRPPKLEPHQLLRIRAAAHHAKKIYPGPVGELIAHELLAWAEFGYLLDRAGLTNRLADHVLAQPLSDAR
ncbi:hypothetical protein ACFQE5_01765 [Pseudonocardia hispaniensis]|uniref:Uncharacterized protein n=1 Tax=Pseudonocardia hispaniensis TaxID=904933 RepID=A0ABW1IXG2_9PSEU